MKIALGADHRGSNILLELTGLLGAAGHELLMVGDCSGQIVDYPDMAYPVARAVASGEAKCGVMVCGSGIGSCIVANKVTGVRAAVAADEVAAERARQHHDANVLCLAADLMGPRDVDRVVQAFLDTEFEGGRHARRINKITVIEATTESAAAG